MSFGNWFTVALSAVASVAPVVTPFIPPPFNFVATGIITMASSLYHLQQPAPK